MFTAVFFLRSGGNLPEGQRGSSLTCYASRIGKDSLEHCESFTKMHLSTLFLRAQFENGLQVKAGLNQKDSPKCRKGLVLSHWISSKRLALWSYGILSLGLPVSSGLRT